MSEYKKNPHGHNQGDKSAERGSEHDRSEKKGHAGQGQQTPKGEHKDHKQGSHDQKNRGNEQKRDDQKKW